MIRKSNVKQQQPLKKMFIKKNVINSKSNSPSVNNTNTTTNTNTNVNKQVIKGVKSPNLCFVSKSSANNINVKITNYSSNSMNLKTSRSANKGNKANSKCYKSNQDDKNKKVLKLSKDNNSSNKYKIVDRNYIIDIEDGSKKYFFDKIFFENESECSMMIEYVKKQMTSLIKNKVDDIKCNIISNHWDEIEMLFTHNKESFISQCLTLIKSIRSNIISKVNLSYIDKENELIELKEDIVNVNDYFKHKSEFIQQMYLQHKLIGITVQYYNNDIKVINSNNEIQYRQIIFTLLNAQSLSLLEIFDTSNGYANCNNSNSNNNTNLNLSKCSISFNKNSIKQLSTIDIYVLPLSKFQFIKSNLHSKSTNTLLNNNLKQHVSYSISPKNNNIKESSSSLSQSPPIVKASLNNTSKSLLTTLKEENAKLKNELTTLKNAYNNLMELFKKSNVNSIIEENKLLLNVNKELNDKLHKQFQHISRLNNKINKIENNEIYTFDNDESDNNSIIINNNNSNSNYINNHNNDEMNTIHETFMNFKKHFNTFFTETSNTISLNNECLYFNQIHKEHLKSTLNSFYCFMEEIINPFIYNVQIKLNNNNEYNCIKNLELNFLEVCAINLYYENLLFELFNHCLYENKRNVYLSQLICNAMFVYKNEVDVNGNNVDNIISSLDKMSKAVDTFIEYGKEERKGIMDKMGEVLKKESQDNLILGVGKIVTKRNQEKNHNQSNTYNFLVNPHNKLIHNEKQLIKSSIINNDVHKNFNTNIHKDSFCGYIKNDDLPSMSYLDDDSQFTE